MNKVAIILITISIVGSVNLNGQNEQPNKKAILFLGEIFDSDSFKIPLPQVNILKQNKTGTSSNNKGEFSIEVNSNDTLIFSHIGFHSMSIYIPDSIKEGKLIAKLYLMSDTTNLEQFFVSSQKDFVDFKKLFLDMEIKQDRNLNNAKNNINLSMYEARNTIPTWMAEDNQKYSIQQEANKVIYAGQIPPNQIIDVIKITETLIKMTTENKKKDDFYKNFINAQNQQNIYFIEN